jgi:hypothetical protein
VTNPVSLDIGSPPFFLAYGTPSVSTPVAGDNAVVTFIPGLPELFTQALFIDFANTGLGYRINLFNAFWDRPVTDKTCLGSLSEPSGNLATIDLSVSPDNKNQWTLAPFFISNADHRGFAYARGRQCQILQFQ